MCDHDEVFAVLASAAGTGAVRAMLESGSAVEGRIPLDYGTSAAVVLADGSLVACPMADSVYVRVELRSAGGDLEQVLLPPATPTPGRTARSSHRTGSERAASAERGELARLLRESDTQRRELFAWQQTALAEQRAATEQARLEREQMLVEQRAAARQAQLEREAAAAAAQAERAQIFEAIARLTSATGPAPPPEQRVLFTPVGSAANPMLIGSGTEVSRASSTTTVDGLLSQQLEMARPVFDTWACEADTFFSPGERAALRANLPRYCFIKDEQLPEKKRALRRIIASLTKIRAGGRREFIEALEPLVIAAGRAFNVAEAAQVQVMVECPAIPQGALDWPAIVLAELSLLGDKAFTRSTVQSLLVARLAQPQTPAEVAAWLRGARIDTVVVGLPVTVNGTAIAGQPQHGPPASAAQQGGARRCWFCSREVSGPFAAHACAQKTAAAAATAAAGVCPQCRKTHAKGTPCK